MIRTRLMLLLTIACAASLTAGCGDGDSANISSEADKAVNPTAEADAAWAALTSSGPTPARIAGESDLDYFLRQVEFSNLRRRELGLAFWDAHPDDPRRYQWLILAVHMAPHYAADFTEWAKEEADHMNINMAAVDGAARDAWDVRYPELRAAFFAADSVSDRQRRFLWFGELEQGLKQMRQAKARGEAVDTQYFLDHYAAFLGAYSARFPDNNATNDEGKAHGPMVQGLWGEVFEANRDIFPWTPETALAFLDRVEAAGEQGLFMTTMSERLRAHIAEKGAMPAPVLRLGGRAVRGAPSDSQRAWQSLEYFLGRAADTPEGVIVAAYKKVIARRKYFEIGQKLWGAYPDRDMQFLWASPIINGGVPYYASSLVDDIRLIAERRAGEVAVDEAAKAAGQARFAELRADFLNAADTTDDQKARWIAAEMRRLRRTFEGDRPGEGGEAGASPEEIARYLENIQALYIEFGSAGAAAGSVGNVVRYPRRFGLSLDDGSLDAFLKPFRSSDDDQMQEVLAQHDRRKAWKTTPLDFTMPLFNGDGDLTLSDLRGKIVYIDPWATWCTGCIADMPELHETYLEYKDEGFEFVSLVSDSTRKGIQRVLDDYELTWPLVLADNFEPGTDDNHEFRSLNASAYLVLNRDGTVYEYHDRKERTMRDILDEMLAAEAEHDEQPE